LYDCFFYFIFSLREYKMSSYGQNFGYPYSLDIKKRVIEMEKKNPYWEPTLYRGSGLSGGKGGGSGRASVGFNDLTVYSDYYKKVPKGYKSSGNAGKTWYSDADLRNINAKGFPYRNFSKREYKNAVDTRKPEDVPLSVYDSIKDAVENDQDYGLLQAPPKKKKTTGRGVGSGGKCGECDGGISKKEKEELVNAIKKIVMTTQQKDEVMGGKFNAHAFKKGLIKTGKTVAVPLTKFGVPAVTQAVTSQLGVPAPVGSVIGKVLGDVATQKVKKAVGKGSVGTYKGGAVSGGAVSGGAVSGGARQRRAAVVKRVMKERGVNLPTASKIVKQENMSY
jgi:hypothetical protein